MLSYIVALLIILAAAVAVATGNGLSVTDAALSGGVQAIELCLKIGGIIAMWSGVMRVAEKADNARNYSQCDSLLLGDKCGAHTFPYMDIHNETAIVEHEATTSKISEDQIFYCNQRGISTEDAVGLIVNGYAKEVLNKLPIETYWFVDWLFVTIATFLLVWLMGRILPKQYIKLFGIN